MYGPYDWLQGVLRTGTGVQLVTGRAADGYDWLHGVLRTGTGLRLVTGSTEDELVYDWL